MTSSNNSYEELLSSTEAQLRAFVGLAQGRPTKVREMQQNRAHGALALWHTLASALPDRLDPAGRDRLEDDHHRLKQLIRRPLAAPVAVKPPSVHAGRTPPTRGSYGSHWQRVQRSVRVMFGPTFGMRLADAVTADWHEFWEDAATMTFIHLHQLKDWFPAPVNALANAYIDEHEALQICADLANTAKHAWLDPDRGGARAKVIASKGGPLITIPLGRQALGLPERATVEIRIAIERDGKTTHLSAVDLVRTCFQLWQQFIDERVATMDLDNAGYSDVWVNKDGRLRPRRSDER